MDRPLDLATIERFLGDYAHALEQGDGARVAQMWQLPALVVSDEGTLAVSTAEQVEQFFSAAPEQYRSRGIVALRPEHLAVEHLSDRLCSVDVRWLGIDEQGRPVHERELSTYLLHTAQDGTPRIVVAVSRPSRIPQDT